MTSEKTVKVIGAGLAGCEAAWQIANMGIKVKLFEMKPTKMSAAHKTADFAELVCSNSFRADGIHNAVGVLKEEMRKLGSLIMQCADATKVPAGGALAVDRTAFAKMVTEKIKSHNNIEVVSEEVSEINTDEYTIVAAGPLASDKIAAEISKLTGGDELHFFDAAAPIVAYDSIDMTKAFKAARYGKGGDDYINCPMTKDEYIAFRNELVSAEAAPVHEGVENQKVFEGCMPIEIMASRGEDTMRFGPLKPVGLTSPHDGSRPYAVVQLRQDNGAASMYNIVGFQTHLKFGEQKRVFGMIPGLENAEFVRYGVMHRNTYINSPKVLTANYNMKEFPKVYFAGQITGVEGYIESASSGLWAGICAAHTVLGKTCPEVSAKTAIGALANYISNPAVSDFQPMNVNFGIFEDLGIRIKDKKEKAEQYAMRSGEEIEKLCLYINRKNVEK
ncbi:MAG: methylenetetrahydrofolate--tRNA-(uracil(54)-C(5))-methyltransferase (FADH(2)-oxidizing) TrmFO [Clostridia bacterium]|nr:methylenetetrahydrofolate--tRNA-(uracil(54)-C(5))-methyltransferase (FADH(2)-oxidizing) TrmFO [Clostridia bacterium]